MPKHELSSATAMDLLPERPRALSRGQLIGAGFALEAVAVMTGLATGNSFYLELGAIATASGGGGYLYGYRQCSRAGLANRFQS